MNFLAHAYLSFNHPDLMVGNFIADFIKGNDYLEYPDPIQRGVLLHREIDQFTDRHQVVQKSKERLYELYSHYAGVIVDMYYDHFLAANFYKFHSDPLDAFANLVYKTVDNHHKILPAKAQRTLHYMSRGNWLLSYARVTGIEQALRGIGQRTRYKSGLEHAGQTLRLNYRLFYRDFMIFFPKVITFAREQIRLI